MAWKFKQPRSAHWWIGYYQDGKKYRRTTGTDDEAQADRELAKLNLIESAHKAGSLTEEFYRLLTRKEFATESLKLYVDQWLKECKDLSPVTQERYSDSINEFLLHIQANESAPLLRDVRPESIGAFLRKKRAETSTATTRLYRKILSAFFNYAVDNRALSVNPVPSAKSLKLTKDSEPVRRAFTLEELKTLYPRPRGGAHESD